MIHLPDDLIYMAWHIHDLITYFDDDVFSWDIVFVYTIFWESIQVLRRGDINVVLKWFSKDFVFAYSRFCFAPLQVLGSVVGGIRGSSRDSDRPSPM